MKKAAADRSFTLTALFHGFQSCAARQIYFVAQGHVVFAGTCGSLRTRRKSRRSSAKTAAALRYQTKPDGQAIFSRLRTVALGCFAPWRDLERCTRGLYWSRVIFANSPPICCGISRITLGLTMPF